MHPKEGKVGFIKFPLNYIPGYLVSACESLKDFGDVSKKENHERLDAPGARSLAARRFAHSGARTTVLGEVTTSLRVSGPHIPERGQELGPDDQAVVRIVRWSG